MKRKNYWKKLLVSLTLVMSMVIGIAGCGNGGEKNPGGTEPGGNDGGSKTGAQYNPFGDYQVTTEDITLTIWHYEDETTATKLAEEFMKLYPNITVEHKLISDMSTDLSAAASAGTMPDVFEGTDSDTALANGWWGDITEYWAADPDTKNLMATINEYGIGCFDTSRRFAAPMMYWPSAIFIDRNVIETLNLDMPDTDWTWDEMIDVIKSATKYDPDMMYYGLGWYNRLDSLYGIAACSNAERAIKGEFGYNGNDFDLQYWAIGEQQFSDLQLAGYVAPTSGSDAMEDWTGDYDGWFGATGHVAVFSEAFWTYQNIWGVEGYQEDLGLDIVPYVTPNVVDEKEHNVISTMYMGGISSSTKYPLESYLLLRFFGWGVDGWNARMDLYEDDTNVNASGVALKHSSMPVPVTLDEGVWARYKALFPQDEEHKVFWDDYFSSITRPVPYGWYSIAGYWNFCDQYFNKIDIHTLVDTGKAKAADYVDEATRQANYYHASAMLAYFGPNSPYATGVGYKDILSADEIAKYQAVVDAFTAQ